MKRAKTSKAWMKEHVNDFFVKQAKKEGYRSRAAYKLLEITEKDQILKPGLTVVDLGAAPGSWSQVASHKIGRGGKVIAVDILEMTSLPGVEFIQGDFREEYVIVELKKNLGNDQLDLVISDMSPNMSGIVISDQARSMYLAELALAFSMEQLNYGGNFLVKVFQGRDFDQFLFDMRAGFKNVIIRKPKASRDRSNELYLLGLGKK
ncbi:RlmE family RNA methyltransferase [Nitrosomonas ureae]|uniref:Ribosomal RNA large subunit methyltransferase E n=1 Tax=Nitrosomonas ureae TaxID=44577 RepID=A0A0S3AMJ3_9PROT|nr:RlmE family RNA methyltransferase [Nitrosomonas ureae]ALQ52387.1 23S rRNA methyltransferase [Nitrosomonas ureae]PXX14356.1 23S rRNA Um-2552 2'-O-methyltransferase [Nitrosomonas ureae]SDT88968.1 23S rRNA Um-2552 2'-O-methyltransferase [Nitrosomonas ureae]SEP87304.1 23S rRNA (uridine2552-2'-O)-methyltransferase [Nitrosomonas ureae]SOD19091.1 23S rRNA Um-2552 2'-O-methyltransferase [Nitrosomonas ureae]